ncbi:MAG: NUDIX domain-containing protein [Chloroflexi bacterium]|nr:NUDIX domain-containing protein [Chloroflexota bacterium]
MIRLAAGTVIVESGKVLLVKREDFEVWCLPGGRVDEGESMAETAVRETREETGLEVELICLIGISSEIGAWSDWHIAGFAAKPIGGELNPQAEEIIDIGYFAPDDLPEEMFWWHRRHIADYFNGMGGSAVWRQDVPAQPGPTNREELYALRDQSGLSRTEFYKWYYESNGRGRETYQVNGKPDKS